MKLFLLSYMPDYDIPCSRGCCTDASGRSSCILKRCESPEEVAEIVAKRTLEHPQGEFANLIFEKLDDEVADYLDTLLEGSIFPSYHHQNTVDIHSASEGTSELADEIKNIANRRIKEIQDEATRKAEERKVAAKLEQVVRQEAEERETLARLQKKYGTG